MYQYCVEIGEKLKTLTTRQLSKYNILYNPMILMILIILRLPVSRWMLFSTNWSDHIRRKWCNDHE